MRTFNYSAIKEQKWDLDVLGLIAAIYKEAGKQELYLRQRPEELEKLVEIAKIQSTEASNAIEGIVTTSARIRQLVEEKTTPRNRDEQEIAGYRDVLATIHESHDYIPPKPTVILQLHRDLMVHTAISYGGHWKDSDNEIISIDDQGNRFVRFRPPSALATPGLIEEACRSLNDALSRQVCDPLLISFRFIFDFVSIHPFNDGNGRMSRLLTTLLLEKTGYDVARYISIERLIEDNKALYYNALAASSTGWNENQNTEVPFIRFMLGTTLAAYRQLEQRTLIESSTRPMSKQARIAVLFQQRPGVIKKSDIRSNCPDISEVTVKRTLGQLVSCSAIEKTGAGRSTGYILKDVHALELFLQSTIPDSEAAITKEAPKDKLLERINHAEDESREELYEDYDSFSRDIKMKYGV